MKTTINKLIVFAVMIFAACTSTPKTYIVEGVFPDASYNNQMVYMYDFELREKTDSVLVMDGKFTFTGSTNTAVIRRVVMNQFSVYIILENGKISVDMADPKSAKGTPLNAELSKFQTEIAVFDQSLNEKRVELQQKDIDEETRNKQNDEIFDQYKTNINTLREKYFNANKNNALGIFIFLEKLFIMEPDLISALYAQAGDIVSNSQRVQRVVRNNESKKQTAEGMLFTDFTIETGNIDGSKASLSDYVGKGKYVLVDFWASWCGPCIAEIPVLVEVYNKYKGEKFEILGVAVWEKREETLKSFDKHSLPWPQIVETNNIATDLYGINTIPHIILFGPDGTIVERGLRGNKLKAKVAEVMK